MKKIKNTIFHRAEKNRTQPKLQNHSDNISGIHALHYTSFQHKNYVRLRRSLVSLVASTCMSLVR